MSQILEAAFILCLFLTILPSYCKKEYMLNVSSSASLSKGEIILTINHTTFINVTLIQNSDCELARISPTGDVILNITKESHVILLVRTFLYEEYLNLTHNYNELYNYSLVDLSASAAGKTLGMGVTVKVLPLCFPELNEIDIMSNCHDEPELTDLVEISITSKFCCNSKVEKNDKIFRLCQERAGKLYCTDYQESDLEVSVSVNNYVIIKQNNLALIGQFKVIDRKVDVTYGCVEIKPKETIPLEGILGPLFTFPFTILCGAIIVVIVYCTYKHCFKKRNKFQQYSPSNLPTTDNYYVANDFIERPNTFDDHDYEEPYFVPASEEEQIIAQIRALGISEVAIEDSSLRILDFLGCGAFGNVYRGLLISSPDEDNREREVAVKSLHGKVTNDDKIKFLQEAVIMGQFNHPNIIKMLGIVLENSLHIVLEIMKKGDLRSHLLTLKQKEGENSSTELPPTLLSFTRQIASGLIYLELKAFIHRDLAARNVLVSENDVCKIADFGLSRDLQDQNFYVQHGGKIPVKWTAPEALNHHRYSTASDVWSYGCVLYEIWSLGHKPFHDTDNSQVLCKIMSGYRLPPPPGCPRPVYEIMIKCWHLEAASRPTVCDVNVSLQKPDFKLLLWDSVEMSEESMRLGAPLEAGKDLHADLQNTYKYVLEDEKENDNVTDKRRKGDSREGRGNLEEGKDTEEGKESFEVKESSDKGKENNTIEGETSKEELKKDKEVSARKDDANSHYYHVLEIQELSY